MKAFQKISIAIATLFVSVVTMSANEVVPTVNIDKVGYEKKISVIVENLLTTATVQITTDNGTVLEKETSKDGRFAKIFNLEQLATGDYSVVITMGHKEIEQPFTIKKDELIVKHNERDEYFIPTVNINEAALDVMMLNNRLTDVDLTILDTNGKTIFQDTMKNVIKVERRYDLNSLRNGRYMVEVKTPRKTYYKDIVVR